MRKLFMMLSLAVAVATIAAMPIQLFASDEAFGFSSEGGSASESYLGVDTRDVTADRLAPLQLKEERGVEVTMVDQDAPAGKSGIKEHDVIVSINGSDVESVEQLRRMIHEIPPGRLISIGLSRNGQPLTVKAQLAARKRGLAMAWPGGENFKMNMPVIPEIPMSEMDLPASIVVVHSSARSGLMVENLTPQLGDYFGVKNGQGILVRSVERGSRAESAGFHAGDVIVRVNGQQISDSGDFAHALNFRKDTTATVTVLRDRKEVTLTLTMPEHAPSGEFFNETLTLPDVDAQTRLELTRVQSEIAELKPEIQKRMQHHAAEMERAQKEFRMHTADLERIQPKIDQATSAANQELKKKLDQVERDIEKISPLVMERLMNGAEI